MELNSKNKKDISELTNRVITLQNASKLLNEQYNESRSKLQGLFDKLQLKSFSTEPTEDGKRYKVTLVERVNITFFADRLKRKLSKELYDEITEKKYEVTNINRLIKLAKEYGISKEEIKECITVKEEVSKDKMKQMSSLGDIKLDQIVGCYNASISKHIQIREEKEEVV